jgi:hypothetical protein
MIYLNNAATTWPKPEIVYETVDDGFRNLASPGRTSGGIGQQSATIMQTYSSTSAIRNDCCLFPRVRTRSIWRFLAKSGTTAMSS